jgi:hypothetical protein
MNVVLGNWLITWFRIKPNIIPIMVQVWKERGNNCTSCKTLKLWSNFSSDLRVIS